MPWRDPITCHQPNSGVQTVYKDSWYFTCSFNTFFVRIITLNPVWISLKQKTNNRQQIWKRSFKRLLQFRGYKDLFYLQSCIILHPAWSHRSESVLNICVFSYVVASLQEMTAQFVHSTPAFWVAQRFGGFFCLKHVLVKPLLEKLCSKVLPSVEVSWTSTHR